MKRRRYGGPVAVTGATGHLGANLVRELLAAGRSVRAVVRHTGPALEGLDVEIALADVLDSSALRAAFEGVSTVFHLAGRISITGDQGGLVTRTNVDGVRSVAHAALEADVRRMVHFSSIHAFDLSSNGRPVDETTPRAGPGNFAYDRSKAGGEAALREVVARGLDAVVINPTGVIGPHDFGPSRMGRTLLRLVRGRMPALVGGGFDWVDSRDVARAALSAEAHGRTGESYLISGHWKSFAELAKIVHTCGGARAPHLRSPFWLAGLFAPFSSLGTKLFGGEPLLTRESLAAVRTRTEVCSAKARRELDHRPRDTRETIRDTLDWFARQA